MLKLETPKYKFCPFCGNKLKARTEEEHIRKYCPICNWAYYPHVATTAGAVIVKKGRVLMVKRNRPPYKGTWMFPAGFVDYGEHPEETIRREVQEETGLKVTKTSFIGVWQVEDDPRARGHFIFFYNASVSEGDIATDLEENEEIAWQDIGHPPVIGWKRHQEVMKMLQKKRA